MGQGCPYKCKNGRVFNPVMGKWQPCPHCSGVIQEIKAKEANDPATVNLLEKLRILPEHVGLTFKPEDFFEPMAYTVFTEITFRPVLEKLTELELALLNGNLLRESCYFYVGLYAKIEEYVSICLQDAIHNGLSAVPYVSLLDLQGIRDGVRHMAKVYENITYYDYTTADVCFIYANPEAGHSEACIMAELLAERSRHGLPTYVIGYWADYALFNNKSAIHFMIDNSTTRLSLLHSFEIVTKARYSSIAMAQNAKIGAVAGKSMADTIESQTQQYIKSRNLGGVTPEKYMEGMDTND